MFFGVKIQIFQLYFPARYFFFDTSIKKTLLTINVGQICPMMSEGGRRGRVGLAGVHGPALVMALVLDGNSEMVAHVRSNVSYLICLRHLIRSK